MSISSLGVGSGLDLNTLVAQLVRAERAPQEGQLNRGQARAQTQLSALGSLKSAVSNLTSAVKALQGFAVTLKGVSTNDSVIGVTTSAGVERGSYQVQVSQLAAAQSMASAGFDDIDASLGAGTLTLAVGTEQVVIEIGEANSSLRGVRDALNASGLPIHSVIVRDGDQHRLLLTSAQSGLASQLTLTVDGVDARLGSASMTETVAARDAEFRVNGLALTAASNQVSDVIPGLTLSLKQVTAEDQSVAITVAPDHASVRTKLDALVKAYNALIDNMNASGRVDPAGDNAGPLVGDATLRAVRDSVAGLFSRSFGEGTMTMLLDLGFKTDVTAKASLDVDRLNAALAGDQASVDALVSAFAGAFGETLDRFSGSQGMLNSRTDSLNAQLRRISQQREALDTRMEQVEARLRAQFTALDSMLAQMQQTSTFLAQQLTNLANLQPRQR